jgi:tRNA-dihydrouridine synthase A
MIGREAYHNPYILAEVDQLFYNEKIAPPSRSEVVDQFIEYADQQIEQGAHIKHMTRHILGLFQGQPGAKKWRRYISENAYLKDANSDVIKNAFVEVNQ